MASIRTSSGNPPTPTQTSPRSLPVRLTTLLPAGRVIDAQLARRDLAPMTREAQYNRPSTLFAGGLALGLELVAAWAQAEGIPQRNRDECSQDFGRVYEGQPGIVLSPTGREQLAAAVTFCARHSQPYKVRGSGHASGGQAVFPGGVIVDLRGLNRILTIAPERGEITVEAGALWQDVVDALAPSGQRPPVLTDNLLTTVGGTLAVGGFGDSSHLEGLQIDHVARLSLITADGARHDLGPSDELFRHALAGRGQFGVVDTVTLKTVRRARHIQARVLYWASLEAYLRDAALIIQHRIWDFLRARVVWTEQGIGVQAVAGTYSETPRLEHSAFMLLSPSEFGPSEHMDLLDALRKSQAEIGQVTDAVPALEFSLPLPAGLACMQQLCRNIAGLGIPSTLARGAALVIVPRSNLPLAPLSADAKYSLMLALRPRLTPDAARALLPALAQLAAQVVTAGGRIYLMSVEVLSATQVAQQFGAAYAPACALRRRVDPHGLCNPWLL